MQVLLYAINMKGHVGRQQFKLKHTSFLGFILHMYITVCDFRSLADCRERISLAVLPNVQQQPHLRWEFHILQILHRHLQIHT